MRSNRIHHVTAIAVSAQQNLDFYTRMLGLRLVKKTVNIDDPGTYDFYYGDETGSPTTLGVRESQVEATVELLDGGTTVPFIARYPSRTPDLCAARAFAGGRANLGRNFQGPALLGGLGRSRAEERT